MHFDVTANILSGRRIRASGSRGQRLRWRTRLRTLLGVLAALAAPLAGALDSDRQQPLFVEADAAEFDEKQSISLYLGNVEVQQGSMRILADEVLVHHKPNRQPQKIIAIGDPVRYRQMLDDDPQEVRAKALRMEYETDSEEITLIDEAELVQGEDRFASDRIVYNRTTDRLTAGTSARGRERVKIRIEPQDNADSR
jgi:lipopolysaccharide export system protein LptA